jgi:type IV secretory pathway TrbF-like protein
MKGERGMQGDYSLLPTPLKQSSPFPATKPRYYHSNFFGGLPMNDHPLKRVLQRQQQLNASRAADDAQADERARQEALAYKTANLVITQATIACDYILRQQKAPYSYVYDAKAGELHLKEKLYNTTAAYCQVDRYGCSVRVKIRIRSWRRDVDDTRYFDSMTLTPERWSELLTELYQMATT